MRTLNLGILAHVDAGKTTLTERLLYAAGVIDEVGSVDEGSTQTDSLELERRRGITIKSAVVSFVIEGVTVNLIDTPGHPDFIAEVDRVLSLLDGAVLVVSAVEGVQAQTRVLMRALRRSNIPMLVFVNKTDRMGARPDEVALEIADLDDGPHPIYFGSAITGAGVDALGHAVATLLPPSEGDPAGPVEATCFKVERGPAGERIAYVRMFNGTLRTRDRIGERRKVTAIKVFENGDAVTRRATEAGEIAKLWGLGDIRIGDTIGPTGNTAKDAHFAPPTLEAVILPSRANDRGRLYNALTQLAEQDPLIDLRQDDVRQELYVSLYGEVQKQVIQETLAIDFGLDVEFHDTTTICIERPNGTGHAVEVMHKPPNPILATIGLRVDPAPTGAGNEFRYEVELGSIPMAFHKAVEETVHATLRQGLDGWQVEDCTVTMTHAGYAPRQSHAHQGFSRAMSSTGADFRNLTPLVLMTALARAGTTVHEPIQRFLLEVPADTAGPILPVLAKLQATPGTPAMRGRACTIEGEIPSARVHELQQQLLGLTRGEGVLDLAFASYQPVRGPAPSRPRTDHNPLNRREYLLRVLRRV
ncbi:MAG: ribosomal protection tetracycline resistance protein [Actinomycetota bacterium]|nr:ribosomal protection tetracycline resistance protein [Actinomycetota bacterium]